MQEKEEFCIMPSNSPYWLNKRFPGSERHEVFEGRTGNREKSIEDGLVVFTTPLLHRIDSKFSIHKTHKKWEAKTNMQEIAKQVYMDYYNKTEEQFYERYRNRFFNRS